MTEKSNARIDVFAKWFRLESANLRRLSAEDAATKIADALESVDGRLGIELGDEILGGERELVFTAYSEPSLFYDVHEIVRKIGNLHGWRLVALKPPRGFDFEIRLGKATMRASNLRFRNAPKIACGISLVVTPTEAAALPRDPDQAEELAWLVVEAGLGEELSARVQHLEFSSDAGSSHPIAKLLKTVQGWTGFPDS